MPKKKGPPKKMGRPKKVIDWKRFDELCALQCTFLEIAVDLGVDGHTLNNNIKEKFDGQTFSTVFKSKRMPGITSLRQRIRDVAYRTENATLLIWSDKKYRHLQGDVDPHAYGIRQPLDIETDKSISIRVEYVDIPDDAMKEKFDFENQDDADT